MCSFECFDVANVKKGFEENIYEIKVSCRATGQYMLKINISWVGDT